MKHRLLIIATLFALTASTVSAQITLTRSDFPETGYLVVSAIDDATPVTPGSPGLNQVWDFSNLVAVSYDSTYYISPSEAPGSQNYPDANIVTSHNPGQFPNGYNLNYWNFSNSSIKGIADESLINIWGDFYIAIYVENTPVPSQLTFPFTYGNSSVQNYTMNFITAYRSAGVTTDSSLTVSHVTMDCLADAAGTMILPDGTYPVLRVKEVWNSVDSTFTWTSGAWVYESDTTSAWTQYRWYANDFGEVGLYREGAKKGNGFTFFKSETLVGVDDPSVRAAFTVYPNPVSSQLYIRSSDPVVTLEILDITGNTLMRYENRSTADVSGLPAGMYLVRLNNGKATGTVKIIKP